MTRLAIEATLIIAASLYGFYLAQRRERLDPDLPGLVDVCTVTAPDLDHPWWLPTRRFVARRPDDPRRLLIEAAQTMRETARRRAEQ